MSIEPIKTYAINPVNSSRQASINATSTQQQPFAALLGAASSAQSTQTEARDASAMAQMAKLQLLQGLFNPNPNATQDSLSALLTMAVRRFERTTAASQEVDAARPEPVSSPSGSLPDSREQIDQLIERVARQVNLKPELIRSVVSAESNFNPSAVSSVGAQGLMQLMPATARELEVSDSFDPQQNLLGGSRYLKQMLDKYDGNLDQALAAYNWGPGNVDRKGLAQMPQETRDYLVKVKQGLSKQTV